MLPRYLLIIYTCATTKLRELHSHSCQWSADPYRGLVLTARHRLHSHSKDGTDNGRR